MLDLNLIRQNTEEVLRRLNTRGATFNFTTILDLDQKNRALLTQIQELQQNRNQLSAQIGQLKKDKKEDEAQKVMQEVLAQKEQLTSLEQKQIEVADQLQAALYEIPNMPAPEVPVGKDETQNVVIDQWGTPKQPKIVKEHDEIAKELGMYHPEEAVKMSGARFVIMSSDLARLERAIGRYMLDLQTKEFGYTELSVPFLVQDQAMYGTTQLPKFREDQFGTTNGYWLIPTSEVPLTNFVREQILDATDLPLRYTSLTPCFRSEAGSAGKDTKGMIRVHQFWKVEMVSITTPDQAIEEHERMTNNARQILQRLDLPYRTVVLCTGDMGFGSEKTYDLEVWLPSQNQYREISSCSRFNDFQARRLKTRMRLPGEKELSFVHTLNGSGLAVGRTLVAILENYYNEDGSVTIPEVLRPYMDGQTLIHKKDT